MARKDQRGPSILRWVWLAFAAAAIYKELQLPPEQRTWNGQVAGFVPYDFRMPTVDRAKERLWNPDGPLIGPHVFGVGWAINLGRAWALAREAVGS